MNKAEEIKKYYNLMMTGVITEEEYYQKKAIILNSDSIIANTTVENNAPESAQQDEVNGSLSVGSSIPQYVNPSFEADQEEYRVVQPEYQSKNKPSFSKVLLICVATIAGLFVLFTIIGLLTNLNSGNNSSSSVSSNSSSNTSISSNSKPLNSNTASANGVKVKIVDVHKTYDSNGDPIAAVELLFTNKNSEPMSLMETASITGFQNGIELYKDEMYLERTYDWDTYYTEIKDGATITVYTALPLQNEKDSVEITVDIIDFSTGRSLSSAGSVFNLAN